MKSKKPLPLWQDEFIGRISEMSNSDLLDAIFDDFSIPDDWDGVYTKAAHWKYEYAKSELRKRLAVWLGESLAHG